MIGVTTVLRSVLAAIFLAAWLIVDWSALAAQPERGFAPALFGQFRTLLAQDYYQQGGAVARPLAPSGVYGGSSSQAAKAARGCASGGTVLRVDPSGTGYDVRVLVGNQVVVVRVDSGGNCY